MADSRRKEMLSDALEACESLYSLVQEFGDNVPEQTVGLIRRVLRRQGLLLTLAAFLLRENPRREDELQKLATECASEQDEIPSTVFRRAAEEMVEKPVPGPSEKTPVPDDVRATIESIEHGGES